MGHPPIQRHQIRSGQGGACAAASERCAGTPPGSPARRACQQDLAGGGATGGPSPSLARPLQQGPGGGRCCGSLQGGSGYEDMAAGAQPGGSPPRTPTPSSPCPAGYSWSVFASLQECLTLGVPLRCPAVAQPVRVRPLQPRLPCPALLHSLLLPVASISGSCTLPNLRRF